MRVHRVPTLRGWMTLVETVPLVPLWLLLLLLLLSERRHESCLSEWLRRHLCDLWLPSGCWLQGC